MPIIMTARYQVSPQAVDRCKQAIKNLVEYVKENEKGTLYYIANQEILNPYAFLHMMIFQDEVALTMHRSSTICVSRTDTHFDTSHRWNMSAA